MPLRTRRTRQRPTPPWTSPASPSPGSRSRPNSACKATDVAAYALDIRPRARRSLRQLDPDARKAVAEAIDNLTVDPRPPGARALTGHRPYLRVRSGDYRVIYLMDDRAASSPSR